ncbi:MAG: oligosaccharide flippase family protein, partial [Candidatus Thorarchaeota archaeon]
TFVKIGLALCLVLAGYGVFGVALGWTLGDFFGVLFYSFYSWSNIRPSVKRVSMGPIVGFAIPVYLSLVAEYIAAYIDRFILLQFNGLVDLAFLSGAITIAGIGSLVYSSVAGSIYPEFSSINANAGMEATIKYAKRASKFVLFLSLPVLLGIASISSPLVVLLLGPAFAPTADPLVPIAIATSIVSLAAITHPLALSFGKARYLLEGNLLGCILGTTFSIWLIPIYGIDGAVAARVILLLSTQIYVWFRVFLGNGNPIDPNAFARILISSILMYITVVVIHDILGFVNLPLLVLIGMMTYFLFIRLTKVLNMRDSEVLLDILPTRIRTIAARFLLFICVEDEIK